MREQYLGIKRQYPDAILFFRLGDFYETFDEDAKVVAEVCEITLTSRPVGKDIRVPLAGVPYHAADNYIARLLKAGYKIAVAEQSDSSDSSIMDREVIRVITPGTVTEESLLRAGANNYLAALITDDFCSALAYADISTGEFVVEEFAGRSSEAVADALVRIGPAECVVLDNDSAAIQIAKTLDLPTGTVEAWQVSNGRARDSLMRHFGVSTLTAFGIEEHPLAIRAAAACLAYITETQPTATESLDSLRFETNSNFMFLDQVVQHTLELTANSRTGEREGSLISVLDRTMTPMGARALRQRLLKPLRDVAAITTRLDGVESFFSEDTLRDKMRDILRRMPDLERLSMRLRQNSISPRHLIAIAAACDVASQVKDLLQDPSLELKGEAITALQEIDPCPKAQKLIEAAILENAPATPNTPGFIRPGFSAELDEIVELAANAHKVLARLEVQEKERTGLKNLKVGHNNVFGYYIEVPRAQADKVPPRYIRKQTLKTTERYFTEELKEIEGRIYSAQERRLALERAQWNLVLSEISTYVPALTKTARAIAVLDVLASLADVARSNAYVRPEVVDDYCLELAGSRHPVVERHLLREGKTFVPNDAHLSQEEEAILVITGPNMAGKSTYLRQVAIITLMAQMGCFVPADAAKIGMVDRVFTRIGAQDELAAGQSTFMVEMVETAGILRQATPRSLVILDEVGRGTSTYDGMAIARAVVEYIHNSPRLGCKTLFATHYHELTDMEHYLPRVRNYNVAVAEERNEVIFLHKIVRGGADRSYGIHVAQLAGVPDEVLVRARAVLEVLEAQKRRSAGAPDETPSARQLALFSSSAEPILKELAELDLNSLTPLQALNYLSELQERATALQKKRRSRR